MSTSESEQQEMSDEVSSPEISDDVPLPINHEDSIEMYDQQESAIVGVESEFEVELGPNSEEPIPFVNRKMQCVQESGKYLGASKRDPSLEECVSAMRDENSLYELLDSILETDGHINHIHDWILFLLCSAHESCEEVFNAPFSLQKSWCENQFKDMVTASKQRVCPKSFGIGDIVWNCETCQRDSTCVLCQECFHRSNHEGHEVYFTRVTLDGGGCCDCGDDQAWKASGFCDRHGDAAVSTSDLSPAFRSVFTKVLGYLSAWMADASIFASDSFEKHLNLFNFSNMGKCSLVASGTARIPTSLSFFYTTVYGNGSSMSTLPLEKLEEVELICEQAWRSGVSQENLKIQCTYPVLRLCKRIAVVTDAIYKLCKGSDALVSILSDAFTKDHILSFEERATEAMHAKAFIVDGTHGESVLHDLILADPFLPDVPSRALNLLYMRMLTDKTFKERFAVVFAETYFRATVSACKSLLFNLDQPQKKEFNGVFGLSVQFMNRDTFVNVLVRKLDFLQDVIKCWRHVVDLGASTSPPPTLNAEADVFAHRLYRLAQTETKYMLQTSGISRFVCLESRPNPASLEQWLCVLRELQGMYPIQRIPSHLPAAEYDNDSYLNAFQISATATLLSMYMLRCLVPEDPSDAEFMNNVPLFEDSLTFFFLFIERFIAEGHRRYEENVGTSKISFVLPLFRFIALAVTNASSAIYSCTGDEKKASRVVSHISREDCFAFAQATMRLLAGSAEIHCSMWLRNGFSAMDSSHIYERRQPQLTRDLDLRALQIAAVEFGGEYIARLAYQYYNLESSLLFDDTNQFANEYHPYLAEQCLEMLVHLTTYVPSCWSEEVPVQALIALDIRREIIHRVAESPLTFSQIYDCAEAVRLGIGRISEEDIRKIVAEICVAKPSSDGMGATVYDLKDWAWLEYDSLHPHQNFEAKGESYERWTAARNRLKKSGSVTTPLAICPLFPANANPLFAKCRSRLLRAIFPVAARAFMLAKRAVLDTDSSVPTSWGSCVALVSVHILTLIIHDGALEESLWLPQTELMSALNAVATVSPIAPFDAEVQEGVQWIVKRLAESSPRLAALLSSTRPGEEGTEAATSAKSATSTGKKSKRNRAQERAMAAIRAAAMQFGEHMEEVEGEDEGEEPFNKVKRNERTLDETPVVDPDCCVCRGVTSNQSLGLLGFLQNSCVFEPSKTGHFPRWSNKCKILSQCGHAMHFECYESWRASHRREENLGSRAVEDVERGEFICPVCKSLANCFIPYDRACNVAQWNRQQRFGDLTELTPSILFEPVVSEELRNFEYQDEMPPSSSAITFMEKLDRNVPDAAKLLCESFSLSLLSNPIESVSKVRTHLQSILSSLNILKNNRLYPLAKLSLDGLCDACFRDGAPETVVGTAAIALLLHECNSRNHLASDLAYQLRKSFMQLFVVRMIQAAADPMAENESDSFKAPWDNSGTQTPVCQNSARSVELWDAPEDEEDLYQTLRRAFYEQVGLRFDELRKWTERVLDEPAPLANSIRLQLTPLVEQCSALLNAIGIHLDALPSVTSALGFIGKTELVEFAKVVGNQNEAMEFVMARLTRAQLADARDQRRPLRVRGLVTLPSDFAVLVAMTHTEERCPQCGLTGHDRAVCLICGQIVIAGNCTRSGEDGGCTIHARQEHQGIGMFYIITSCRVLLLNGIKGALWPSLYVDKNGEERQSITRALPLRLEPRRMSRVQQLFITHGVPQEITSQRHLVDRILRDAVY